MRVHIISTLNGVILFLSSRLIPLSTLDDNLLYKDIPKIKDNEFIISFNVFKNEIPYMEKITEGVYFLDKNVSTEYRNPEILYVDEPNGEKVKNLPSIYRDIKDMDLRCIRKINGNHNNTNYSHISPVSRSSIIKEFDKELTSKFDRYKGLLYMYTAYFPNLLEIVLNDHISYYEYFTKTNKLIKDLRDSHLLDKDTYYSSLRFLNQLERNIMKELNKLTQKNLLFTITEDYKVSFNPEFLNLSVPEKILFDYMVYYITSNKDPNIKDLILYTKKVIKFNDKLEPFSNDINVIIDRIINQSYLTDINSIKSGLLKNLYSFSINYMDAKDLYIFNKNTELNQSYLSYMLYGVFFGYSKITNALIFDDLIDPFSTKVLLKSIQSLENKSFDLRTNIQYTRDRLFYIILVILNHNIDLGIDGITIEKSKRNNINILEISCNDDSIVIEYYPRAKRMANNIIYFDKTIRRLKNITKNKVLQENNLVFSYYFKKNNKIFPLNLNLEKKYMILLEYIYNNFK